MRGLRQLVRAAMAVGALAALLTAGAIAATTSAQAADKVTIRFTWKLKGEYAPLFVALDKGYYKAEGLDVDLAEGSGAQTVLKLLATGNEAFGYGPAVAAAQATSKNLPVKVVALYQTKVPMGVISFPNVPLKSPKDLEGKRIGISIGETFGDMLGPFTRMNHVDLNKITRIQMDNAARTVQFLTKKVDVMSVYLSNELPQLEQRTGVKFNVMRVADFGLQLPGASIIVGSDYAAKHADIVKKVLRATNKGYADAMKDPAGAAQIVGKHFKVPENAKVLQEQVKATMESTNAPAGKPIGWQESSDWENSLKLLKETGGISEIKPLDAYYTNQYLR